MCRVYTVHCGGFILFDDIFRGGSFSQKIESANPAQLAKRANPRYFIMLCVISCE